INSHGNMLGGLWPDFLIIAGVWLLLGFIIWKARERLLQIPIMNVILKAFSAPAKDDVQD
ncbi:MAG TPA: hypothetical protein VN451_06410, partial [Chitinophagaceae bacterium]|nr:hypothetical protein [Chitinophagaceae bacterium]